MITSQTHEQHSSDTNAKNGYLLWMIAVLIMGAILRFWGIAHDYPYSFYPDEAHFVKRALSFGSGDLNPHWFHKPAFLMYLLFFLYGCFFIVGWFVGLWKEVSDFAVFYITNPGPFYIIGRSLVVLFSTGLIWITYLAGKKLFHPRVGLTAGLAVAVSYGLVLVSRDVKADIPCAFFTILSAYWMICHMKEEKIRYLYLSAVAAGVGTATKTYSIVMLAPVFLAVWSQLGNIRFSVIADRLRRYLFCLLLFIAAYFICSPFNFLDPLGRKATFGWFPHLAQRVEYLFSGNFVVGSTEKGEAAQQATFDPSTGKTYAQGFLDYGKVLVSGMGSVAAGFCLIGLLLFVHKRPAYPFFCFLVFPILFSLIAIVTFPGYSEIRHQIVVYPFLAVLAAWGIHETAEFLPHPVVAGYIFMALLLVPVPAIVENNRFVSRKDTRNIAKEWIEKNIPNGSKVILVEDGPELVQTVEQVRKLLEKSRRADPQGQFTAHYDTYLKYKLIAASRSIVTYHIYPIRFPWWRQSEVQKGVHELNSDFDKDMGNPLLKVGVESYDRYIEFGVEYAIVHSYRYAAFLKDTEISKKFPSFKNFYHQLFERARIIHRILPDQNGVKRPGPEVIIFKLTPEPETNAAIMIGNTIWK